LISAAVDLRHTHTRIKACANLILNATPFVIIPTIRLKNIPADSLKILKRHLMHEKSNKKKKADL